MQKEAAMASVEDGIAARITHRNADYLTNIANVGGIR